MTLRVPAIVLSLALASTATSRGSAQDADDAPTARAAAKAHLERGLRYFSTQEYGPAIAEFKTGYQLDPNPDFLYALGQAQRLQGNCRDAVQAYKAFLRTNPPEKQADLARGNLTKCEAELAREPAPPPPAPTEAPAAPAVTEKAPPPQPPRPVRPEPSTSTPPFYTDWLGDALAGVGITGLAVAGGVWLAARGHASSANDARTFDAYESERDSAHELQAAALVTGGIGAALLIGGVVRFATRPPVGSSVTVSVASAGKGGRLGLVGRF